MWRNWLAGSRDIFRAVSTDGGDTFDEGVKLGTGTWPLKACPMDGGSLAVAGKETAYVWRRESKVFATTANEQKALISESGKQPIVVPAIKGGFEFIWQGNEGLYRKKQTEPEARMFAKGGEYPSAAWTGTTRGRFVVWEAPVAGTRSVFFEKLQ